jgi:hypothetical protein
MIGGVNVRNERLDLVSRDHVLQAAATIRPKNIHRWSVIVEGREFPVKQLMMAAANLVESDAPRITPADLIPHSAVRALRKMGFEVRYAEE